MRTIGYGIIGCGMISEIHAKALAEIEGAKLTFEYIIYRADDMEIMATARTTQVFTTADGEMQYTDPQFFAEWKERWLKN